MHVIPADAVALLAKGKLDPRLFDVTELVEDGYDDASTDRLPLIVDYAGPTPRSAAAAGQSRTAHDERHGRLGRAVGRLLALGAARPSTSGSTAGSS